MSRRYSTAECEHEDSYSDGIRSWCSDCGADWLLDEDYDEAHPDEQEELR